MDFEFKKDEKFSSEIDTKVSKIEDGNDIHQRPKIIINNYGKYKIINKLYKTKNGELFLITNENKIDEKNLYILKKIEIKTKEKKSK